MSGYGSDASGFTCRQHNFKIVQIDLEKTYEQCECGQTKASVHDGEIKKSGYLDLIKRQTERIACLEEDISKFIEYGGVTRKSLQTAIERIALLEGDLAEARHNTAQRCAEICGELGELNRLNERDSMWEWMECAAGIRKEFGL